MEFSKFIIIVGIALIILALIMFPNLRTLFKGLVNVFIEDKAKTPEGAEAVYQQAIDEATNDYCRASDVLRDLSGRLSIAKRDLQDTKEKYAVVTQACENLVKNGLIDKAQIKAQERAELEVDVKNYTTAVNKLIPLVADAKDVTEKCENKLETLKREKKQRIEEMKLNRELTKAYDNLDDLKNNSSVRKLLSSVEEGSRELQEKATGAKVVHENKLSTKIENADKTAQQLSTNNYIDELRKKYNK